MSREIILIHVDRTMLDSPQVHVKWREDLSNWDAPDGEATFFDNDGRDLWAALEAGKLKKVLLEKLDALSVKAKDTTALQKRMKEASDAELAVSRALKAKEEAESRAATALAAAEAAEAEAARRIAAANAKG